MQIYELMVSATLHDGSEQEFHCEQSTFFDTQDKINNDLVREVMIEAAIWLNDYTVENHNLVLDELIGGSSTDNPKLLGLSRRTHPDAPTLSGEILVTFRSHPLN